MRLRGVGQFGGSAGSTPRLEADERRALLAVAARHCLERMRQPFAYS